MHYHNIFSTEQKELLPVLSAFKKEFYLVGGTALALQIGHRQSIDFDLFKMQPINRKKILNKLNDLKIKYIVGYNNFEQLNLIINEVKFTFFQYMFDVPHDVKYENIITMPDLINIAAMKALGKRAKWKDYVDLYFLIKYHFTIDQIAERASIIYQDLFSIKLFKSQLIYFDFINYEEEVIYLGAPVPEQEIKDFLIDKATEKF
ncbi:MAG: nucleotidyl transferase AbiEii/AbiGii toxin family protein [Cytophagales bacterium]|nr:nucleotidyl transferase AbiEii/AbiGii toxin family protein [Cytophagales bacterium]